MADAAARDSETVLPVIPRPLSATRSGDEFALPAAPGVWSDFETGAAAAWLSTALATLTGGDFSSTAGRAVDIQITVNPRSLPEEARRPEGYRLTVTNDGVRIVGFDPAGALYGCVTLTQLLREESGTWFAPGLEIVDAPRFAYRGAMLDIARHFFGVEDIKRYIDHLVSLKLNALHLHLSDDQGWRIQIDAWPKLTSVAAHSAALGDEGGFLTKADYAAIVHYAAARNITVVPEIDVPGHTHAVGVAYPEFVEQPVINAEMQAEAAQLGQALPVLGQPYEGWTVGHSSLRMGDVATLEFVDTVLAELAELTPGPYLHIGGDEALGTAADDFADFVSHVSATVVALGKTPIAWHEAGAAANLADGTIAQYWNLRSPEPGHAEKARAVVPRGGKVIVSPADAIYLDMKPHADAQLGLSWAGIVPLEQAYSWDPSETLAGIDESAILGVEAPLWTETARTIADVETLAFPRIYAASEIGWSARELRDWDDFVSRVERKTQ